MKVIGRILRFTLISVIFAGFFGATYSSIVADDLGSLLGWAIIGAFCFAGAFVILLWSFFGKMFFPQ